MKVNGKVYKGAELQQELTRGTSLYGRTDVGNFAVFRPRAETFAENYVLYVGAGAKYKKEYPVSYEWTRKTIEMSLNSKYNTF